MVQLAVQLVQRQSGRYDPADLEDRYETRLRAMIDAKLAGVAIEAEAAPMVAQGNVIDLMAALKKSLGAESSSEAAKPAKPVKKVKAATPEETRRQPAFKLPIEGGKKRLTQEAERVADTAKPEPVARARRKA